MVFCYTHTYMPYTDIIRKLSSCSNGNKYRDSQPDVTQRVRDLGTHGPKWDLHQISPLRAERTFER